MHPNGHGDGGVSHDSQGSRPMSQSQETAKRLINVNQNKKGGDDMSGGSEIGTNSRLGSQENGNGSLKLAHKNALSPG